MGGGPELHYSLPARTAGSFGSSLPGRIAESFTLTWFRFEVFLAWIVVILAALLGSSQSAAQPLLTVITSPIMAVAIWALMKLTGWIFYFLPGIGQLWGWGRLMFLWAFSRLVVQQAPTIDIPAWSR